MCFSCQIFKISLSFSSCVFNFFQPTSVRSVIQLVQQAVGTLEDCTQAHLCWLHTTLRRLCVGKYLPKCSPIKQTLDSRERL